MRGFVSAVAFAEIGRAGAADADPERRRVPVGNAGFGCADHLGWETSSGPLRAGTDPGQASRLPVHFVLYVAPVNRAEVILLEWSLGA